MDSLMDVNSESSDSEDDCDYVPPEGAESDASGDDVSDAESDSNEKGKKAVKKKRFSKKSTKSTEGNDSSESDKSGEVEVANLAVQDEKKRVDELFKSFLEDVQPAFEKPSSTSISNSCDLSKPFQRVSVDQKKEVFDEKGAFLVERVPGAKAEVPLMAGSSFGESPKSGYSKESTKQQPRKRSGGALSSILGVLGKQKKMSTLEKSQLDWNDFKKQEGISEELEHHNKGKGGYVERQAFLQRTDLRQFEIEKSLRLSKNKNV